MVDKNLAHELSRLILEASGALNEAARLVSVSQCEEAEKQALLLAIGRAMGGLGIEILNPLYLRHPELKPPDFMLPEDFKDE